MSQRNDAGFMTLLANAATARHLLCTCNSDGEWEICAGATQIPLGSVQGSAATAASDPLTCKLLNAPGSHKLVAGAAIARGASVCAIAGGKIDDSALAGSYEIGIAVEAAAADGDVIEVIPVGSIGVVNP